MVLSSYKVAEWTRIAYYFIILFLFSVTSLVSSNLVYYFESSISKWTCGEGIGRENFIGFDEVYGLFVELE